MKGFLRESVLLFVLTVIINAAILKPEAECGDGTSFLPYPGDCTKYIQCTEEGQVVQQCPEGLYWNQKAQICDFPDNVDCKTTNSTTVAPPTNATTVLPHTNSTEAPTTPIPTNATALPTTPTPTNATNLPTVSPTNATTIVPTTPSPTTNATHSPTTAGPTNATAVPTTSIPDSCPSNSSKLSPYPGDCSKFIRCQNGTEAVLQCPDGLLWNQVIGACDFAENVDCDDESCEEGSPPQAYPGDCSKFIECHEGEREALSCPDGLLWNQDLLACDFPENVDCDAIKCPKNGSALLGYPGDCSKFIQCKDGEETILNCPDGLYWNPEVYACDYSSIEHCNKAII